MLLTNPAGCQPFRLSDIEEGLTNMCTVRQMFREGKQIWLMILGIVFLRFTMLFKLCVSHSSIESISEYIEFLPSSDA